MRHQIYRKAVPIAFVSLDNDSSHEFALMGDDFIKYSFHLSEYINFNIDDYIFYNSQYYVLNRLPEVVKEGPEAYHYTCIFEGPHYQLGKIMFLFIDCAPDFDYTATAEEFLNLVINNINRVDENITAGSCPGSDVKTIHFENENVLQALGKICENFKIEWYLNNTQLIFGSKLNNTGLIFKVGRSEGLYSLMRKNIESANLITRLWAFGSTKNLPADYRGGKKRLIFANSSLEDESRVETNIDLYGIFEKVNIFDDIFPSRIGKVTSVNESDMTKFYDSNINFNLNDYLLPGLTPKINFKTGSLAGFTFNFNYIHLSREITLELLQDAGNEYPNTSLKPAINDEYVIFDIEMPQSYIDEAEIALRAAAEENLNTYSTPQVIYSLAVDKIYARQNNIKLMPGDQIHIIDLDFDLNVDLRVIKVSRSILDQYTYSCEIGDLISKPVLKKINDKLRFNEQEINQLKKSKLDSLKSRTIIQNMINEIDGGAA